MKWIQVFYVIMAVALSVVILGASCFQFSERNHAIEIPLEEPVDENPKDISDDFADDKEYISHQCISTNKALNELHSDIYIINYADQLKEINTPPPKS